VAYFRKLFFKRVTGIRDTYVLQEGDIALDEDDFKLYRGDGSTPGGIVISGAGGGSGIALTDISVTQASASGAGTLAYNSSTGVFTYTPPTASGLGAKTSVSEADVTQHQSALSITESQISDFGTYLTSVAFADITSKPTTIAGYGITDAFDGAFGSLSGTPTTLAGYGITDAATLNNMAPTGAVDFTGATSVNFTGATVSGLNFYTDSDVDTHLNTSTASSSEVLSWNGTDYDWVAQSGGGGGIASVADDTTPQLGGNLDLNNFDITGTGDINITGTITSSGDNTFTGTTDFDTITTDGLSIVDNNISSNRSNDDLILSPSGTGSINLNGTVTGSGVLDEDDMSSDSDVHLATQQSIKAYVDSQSGGSSLQSRTTKAGTTGSLADAAEENLDITGFKGYALLKVQTDRAARVRIYTDAASRTADASRAEGSDPAADDGVIAEVITTAAETVLISPGAFGFNNESTPTTTIPCRVTNKSGGASTVTVTLHVLQLES